MLLYIENGQVKDKMKCEMDNKIIKVISTMVFLFIIFYNKKTCNYSTYI